MNKFNIGDDVKTTRLVYNDANGKEYDSYKIIKIVEDGVYQGITYDNCVWMLQDNIIEIIQDREGIRCLKQKL